MRRADARNLAIIYPCSARAAFFLSLARLSLGCSRAMNLQIAACLRCAIVSSSGSETSLTHARMCVCPRLRVCYILIYTRSFSSFFLLFLFSSSSSSLYGRDGFVSRLSHCSFRLADVVRFLTVFLPGIFGAKLFSRSGAE